MLELDHAPQMDSALFSKVCRMREFWGRIASEVNILPVQLDGRLKPSAMHSHSKKSACVALLCNSLVLHVHRRGYAPKVVNPVIGFVPVNVVDVPVGPLGMNIKPSKPVRLVDSPGDVDVDIPAISLASGRISFGGAPPPSMRDARKKSSVLVIGKKFSQALRVNADIGHESLQWSRYFTPNPLLEY
jgi:hypothetical protein